MSERICPHCKNTVYDDDALLCHFCGGSLGLVSDGAIGKLRGAGMKWVWIALAFVIALAMVMQMF